MNTLIVTSLTALMCGAWFLILTALVVMKRRGDGIVLGDNDDRIMEKLIRGQANAAEQMPIFLIILALAEFNGATAALLAPTATLFTLGRISHGYYFGWHGTHWRFRFYGMLATLTAQILALILLAISLL